MGVTRPIFGAISCVLGLNIPGKFQGHSSTASDLSGESFLAFLAWSPMFGADTCPQLDPCSQNFYGFIYYVIQCTKLESLVFLARLVLEIWKCKHWHSYSGTADIGRRACEISEKVWTRKWKPQLCIISTFWDKISQFPELRGEAFFHPKVTVGLGNFAPRSRLIMGAL